MQYLKPIMNQKVPSDTDDSSTWDQLVRPRPFVLFILICLGIFLQLTINYSYNFV